MNYRPEIDGLRALAILPVIFFHAGFKYFEFGYLGVDIFFVISGFLITAFILKDLKKEKFSIQNFYDRRARRILPGLMLVMIFSIPFALIFMQPDDLENFGQSLFATIFFSNNILLYLTSGYWDISSEFKPLLHTWSLSIEEQYYFIFPFIMLLVWKLKSVRAIISIFILLASFSYYYFYTNFDLELEQNRSAFLLLFARAWEIILGVIGALLYLGFSESSKTLRKITKELLCFIGFSFIFLSLFNNHLFQYEKIVLPLLASFGTFLILMFASKNLLVTFFLRSKLLVGIGLISYSLYLWHQPLFAFFRISSYEEPNLFVMWVLIFLAVILALISNYFERLFKSPKKVSNKLFYSSLLVTMISISSVGLLFNFTNGFFKNHEELILPNSLNDALNDNDGYVREAYIFSDLEFSNVKNNLVITGDSFARDFINMGRSNSYFSNFEFTHRSYNCFNHQNYPESSQSYLLRDADLVIVAYRILRTIESKECLIRKLQYLENNKLNYLVIGSKDFGYNINRPFKKKQYDYMATPSESILDFNKFLNEVVPSDQYIDLLSMVSVNNRIPLFTEDRKLISIDRSHLTYYGAKKYGTILFNDKRLEILK